MQVGTAYNAGSLWDLDAVSAVDSSSQRAAAASRGDASGDTVSISDEARKLFSEKIHKYDAGSSTPTAEGEGGGGGSSASGSGDTESIKKQIESLTSQLLSLTSQISGGAADAGVNSKINALQAQIAALEAQLNAAEQA